MLLESILICLAIVCMNYFFWYCCQKVFFIRSLEGIPGPKPFPLIGSLYHLLKKDHEDFLDGILKFTEDFPSISQLWIGSKLIITLTNPDMAKTVLYSKNCIDKGIPYKIVMPLFGTGLLTAPESIWTRMRKMTAPIFGSHVLQDFFNKFVKHSVQFTHELEKIGINGHEIVYVNYLMNCSWKIASDCLMGVQLEPQKNNKVINILHSLKECFSYRLMNLYIYFFDIVFHFSTMGRKTKKYVNLFHSLVNEIIQQSEDELSNLNTIKDKEKQIYKTYFDILMDYTNRKERLTRDKICNNVLTMLLTASESIATTMNFVIFMLANYPEIQEKAHKELLEIYGTETVNSAPVKYNDLQNMHYLDRVIKETLRIFPPAPLIARKVMEDLNIGKVVIPKGADIMIVILKIHRDKEYWSNPLVFDPDRFLPERIKDCHASSYIPFSDGPRNCIGIKYGIMSMKVILATLIRTFIFKVNKSIEIDKIKLSFDVVISPVEPFKVKIEKRRF